MDRLRELQSRLSLEQDPISKQAIQEQLLSLVQERFFELVHMITEEHDPERMRVLASQLNEMIEIEGPNHYNRIFP